MAFDWRVNLSPSSSPIRPLCQSSSWLRATIGGEGVSALFPTLPRLAVPARSDAPFLPCAITDEQAQAHQIEAAIVE
eukprot:2569809-Amphidinium_carterae.1